MLTRGQKRKIESSDRTLEATITKAAYYEDSPNESLAYKGVAKQVTDGQNEIWFEDTDSVQTRYHANRFDMILYIEVRSKGLGHTFTCSWLRPIESVIIALQDTGVDVIDVSAVASTLVRLWVEIRVPIPKLRITGLHKCQKLIKLLIRGPETETETESSDRPVIDALVSPKLVLLNKLRHFELDRCNVSRLPIELVSSPDWSGFRVNVNTYADADAMADRAHKLFKLYVAILRGLKHRDASPSTAWVRTVLRGPLHDPSIIVKIALRLCPMLTWPSSKVWRHTWR